MREMLLSDSDDVSRPCPIFDPKSPCEYDRVSTIMRLLGNDECPIVNASTHYCPKHTDLDTERLRTVPLSDDE